MQRQLTLDLGTPPPSTFDNFHTGANTELVARLRGLDTALAAGPVADRTFYVWGEPGSGRSHLLHALVHETPSGGARYLGPQSALAAFGFDPRVAIYAVDDCDALSGAQQIALFNLFNEVRAHPTCALVATGSAAPMGLAVREDLRTRLGWGLVFHLAPLADADKSSVLKRAARERGIALADDVPAYLLTHFRRDMPSLMALLDALDRFSLEQKRAVTLPLLRTMLAAGLPTDGGAAVAAAAAAAAAAAGNFDDGIDDELDLFSVDPALVPGAGIHAGSGAGSGTGSGTESDDIGGERTLSARADAPACPAAPYEPARAPASQPRAPQPAPFATPTDSVDGELGASFRDVVERELGGELTGEVEADVSGELNGELGGELSSELSGEPSSEPSGEPGGDLSSELSGEPGGEPSGEPSGELSGEPGGDLSAEPDGNPNAAATDATEAAAQSTPHAPSEPRARVSDSPSAGPATDPQQADKPAAANGFIRFK